MRHRRKLVAAANALFAKTRRENAPDSGNKRCAAGKKDAVNGAGMDAGLCEQAVYACLDGVQVFTDPGFKFAAGDRNAQVEGGRDGAALAEAEFSGQFLR